MSNTHFGGFIIYSCGFGSISISRISSTVFEMPIRIFASFIPNCIYMSQSENFSPSSHCWYTGNYLERAEIQMEKKFNLKKLLWYLFFVQAKATGDDLQRCGRVTGLLRNCISDLSTVATSFGNLYSSCFDGDPDTLSQIHIMQHLCLCLSQWIEMVCLKSSRQGTIYEDITIAFSPNSIEGTYTIHSKVHFR